jgi:hypothetical protein
MTTPIRINCESTEEVPPLDTIRMLADSDHHVVLKFPGRVDKRTTISKLRASLPEHSVFDSGGDRTTDWVTVTPVVPRATVLAHAREIEAAVRCYIEACSTMIGKYEKGTLSEEWSSDLHGGHRRFENSRTGQVIEAPLGDAPEPSRVDPYFFALYAKSTVGLEGVARLLRNDFHDAARMRDVLFGAAGNTQPCASPNCGSAASLGNSDIDGRPPSVS